MRSVTGDLCGHAWNRHAVKRRWESAHASNGAFSYLFLAHLSPPISLAAVFWSCINIGQLPEDKQQLRAMFLQSKSPLVSCRGKCHTATQPLLWSPVSVSRSGEGCLVFVNWMRWSFSDKGMLTGSCYPQGRHLDFTIRVCSFTLYNEGILISMS